MFYSLYTAKNHTQGEGKFNLEEKIMKMNVPNILTMLRMILIPVFVACFIYIPNQLIAGLIACGVFIVASLTDMLDGKIARKYNMVTSFGKIMDPLADKLLVFSAFVLLAVKLFESENGVIAGHVMIWACVIVFFRELGVTSIRAVCASSAGKVVAANFFGKAKTVTQMACIIVALIELALIESGTFTLTMYIPTYVLTGLMLIMTVGSGINYVKIYAPYLKTDNE